MPQPTLVALWRKVREADRRLQEQDERCLTTEEGAEHGPGENPDADWLNAVSQQIHHMGAFLDALRSLSEDQVEGLLTGQATTSAPDWGSP